jgi:hypothetical protein
MTNFDIVIFEGLFTTIYQKDIQGFSNAKFVYRAHNIEHEIWQQLAKKERNFIKKYFLKLLAKNLKNVSQSNLKYDDATGLGKSITPYTDITQALFTKRNNNFETFCQKFVEIFTPNQKQLKPIIENIRKSLGSYEFTAGKVNGYSYTINEDGTYDCYIEILQSNQFSLAIPMNVKGKQTKQKAASNQSLPIEEQIKGAIFADFGIDPDEANTKNFLRNYVNEFFNFNKKNEQQKDTLSNSSAYVTLRFVLKFLMNLSTLGDPDNKDKVEDDFLFLLPTYKVKNNDTEVIPVHSSKYILSSSSDILFPNKNLPKISINTGTDSDENKFIIEPGTEDGTINKYTFNFSEKPIAYEPCDGPLITLTNDDKLVVGNALNIFLKYTTVLNLYNKSATRADFLRDILDLVNVNSYGLFKLVVQPMEQNGMVTVVDYKFSPNAIQPTTYRFKPTTINSIVRKFNFNFEMDSLIAGKMMFDSNALIRNGKLKAKDKKSTTNTQAPAAKYSYRTLDASAFGNADGWYSLNNVEVKRQDNLVPKVNEKKPTTENLNKTDSKTTQDKAPDLSDIIKSKSKYYNVDAKQNVRLVYLDQQLIQSKIGDDGMPQKSILSPINVSLTIDGFSGFRSGQCFHIDGVPEIYNQLGAFQITNIKHSVSNEEGWLTTIEAGLHVGLLK